MTTAINAPPIVHSALALNRVLPFIALNFDAGQSVQATNTSAQSTVFSASKDTIVELCANAPATGTGAWYSIGLNPTAAANTAGNQFAMPGVIRYVYVPAGYIIAVIRDGSTSSYVQMIPAQ